MSEEQINDLLGKYGVAFEWKDGEKYCYRFYSLPECCIEFDRSFDNMDVEGAFCTAMDLAFEIVALELHPANPNWPIWMGGQPKEES